MTLKVNEIFYSIQGESLNLGRPCVTIQTETLGRFPGAAAATVTPSDGCGWCTTSVVVTLF